MFVLTQQPINLLVLRCIRSTPYSWHLPPDLCVIIIEYATSMHIPRRTIAVTNNVLGTVLTALDYV